MLQTQAGEVRWRASTCVLTAPTVSNLQQEGLVYLDGIVLKRSWTREVATIAVDGDAVNGKGYREIFDIARGLRRTRPAGARFSSISGTWSRAADLIDACLGLAPRARPSSSRCLATLCRALVPRHIRLGLTSQRLRGRIQHGSCRCGSTRGDATVGRVAPT